MTFVVALGIVVPLTLASALVGVRVGRRIAGELSDSERTQLYGMQASLLGLLALLLGFSFAMAQTRFDLRKQLVVDESNAVGTARLRAGVVGDEPMQRLLDDYVAVRLAGYAARDDAALAAVIDRSLALQRQLWTRISELGRRQPQSLPVSLLMQSVNEVIDLHTKRLAAGRNHVPGAVLLMLLFVAAVTMGWVGAGVGVGHRRGTATTLLLSLLISLVVGVVVDLDQPRAGLIRISQRPLAELLQSPP